MSVRDAMTKEVFTLSADTPLKEAMRNLMERRVSSAPVIDADGALMGILSESDMLWREAGQPLEHWVVPPCVLLLRDASVC